MDFLYDRLGLDVMSVIFAFSALRDKLTIGGPLLAAFEARYSRTVIYYFPDTSIISKRWFYLDNVLHRRDGPAQEIFNYDGKLMVEFWIYCDMEHRCDGPSHTQYQFGKISHERWMQYGQPRTIEPFEIEYWPNNKPHTEQWVQRQDGPVQIEYDFDGKKLVEHWHNRRMFPDQNSHPSVIHYDDNEQILSQNWYINADPVKFHRDKGPARIQYCMGVKISSEWYQYNHLSRLDGPARTEYYSDGRVKKQEWIICGYGRHRLDGPALIVYSKKGVIIKQRKYVNNQHIKKS